MCNRLKKILYLAFTDPYGSLGVYGKQFDFCKAMYNICRNSGLDFKGVNIYTPDHLRSGVNIILESEKFLELKQVSDKLYSAFSSKRFIRAFFRIRPVLRAAYKELVDFRPDVVIYRYNITYVPVLFNPKRICPEVLFLSEHQSKELDEVRLKSFGRAVSMIEKIRGKRFLRNVDAIVAVTSEIATCELNRIGSEAPHFVLANGIDVARIPAKKYLAFGGCNLKMISVVGETSIWHGLDRLLIGMANYQGDVDLELDIVGFVTADIKHLVKSLGLERRVAFHGLRYGKEIDRIFDETHIAIGTLGIHRKGLKYGSTLKVREYMARGVPFIISHVDQDVDEDFPLFLQLSSDDSPVCMGELIKFAKRVYGRYGQAIPIVMRDYAYKKFDYSVKARSLLNFISSLTKL